MLREHSQTTLDNTTQRLERLFPGARFRHQRQTAPETAEDDQQARVLQRDVFALTVGRASVPFLRHVPKSLPGALQVEAPSPGLAPCRSDYRDAAAN